MLGDEEQLERKKEKINKHYDWLNTFNIGMLYIIFMVLYLKNNKDVFFFAFLFTNLTVLIQTCFYFRYEKLIDKTRNELIVIHSIMFYYFFGFR